MVNKDKNFMRKAVWEKRKVWASQEVLLEILKKLYVSKIWFN